MQYDYYFELYWNALPLAQSPTTTPIMIEAFKQIAYAAWLDGRERGRDEAAQDAAGEDF